MGERYKPLSNGLQRLLIYVMTTSSAITRGSSGHGYFSHCSAHTRSMSKRCAQIASHSQLHHHISHRSQEFNLFRLELFYAATVACGSLMSSHYPRSLYLCPCLQVVIVVSKSTMQSAHKGCTSAERWIRSSTPKCENAGAAIGCSMASTVLPHCPSSPLPHPPLLDLVLTLPTGPILKLKRFNNKFTSTKTASVCAFHSRYIRLVSPHRQNH